MAKMTSEQGGRVREALKHAAGRAVYAMSPQCRFRDCIFILAHMRCGSTALSNILCSRADVSGYGEPHISFDTPDALGRLVVNQALRGAWTPKAAHLFAKNLHSRYDAAAHPRFYRARAIFVARRPAPAIRSIRTLFATLGRDEYRTDEAAAHYYLRRMDALVKHWARFEPARRIGLTFDALVGDPGAELSRISTAFGFDPPLENRYVSRAASRAGGAGDPLASGHFTRIEPRAPEPAEVEQVRLDLPVALRDGVEEAYARYVATVMPRPAEF